jgi:uncharacterized protein YacL
VGHTYNPAVAVRGKRRGNTSSEGAGASAQRVVKPAGPPPDPGRVLLAKILATLFGTLIGLIVASLLNFYFTADWEMLREEAQKTIAKSSERLEEIQAQSAELSRRFQRLSSTPNLSPAEIEEFAQVKAQLQPFADEKQELEDKVQFAELVQLKEAQDNITELSWYSFALIVVLSMLGYLLYPLLARWIDRSANTWVAIYAQAERRSQTLLIGFFAGLVLAVLLLLAVFTTFNSGPFGSPLFRLVFGTFFAAGMGMAGSLVAVNYFGPGPRRVDPYREFRVMAKPKILDTSVLIDGRVQEVAATGFLDGALVVTNSVLRELQSLADSGDGRKRDKGRRGLELVHAMQEDPRLDVRIFDDSTLYENGRATDEQLIVIAQAMSGSVVTNDYNLNRVAAIRDVQVINLNALANAVKTRHVPGDMIEIHIADRGKQRGQGVGYLEDGTMVVVEDGEPFIRQTRWIKLTSVTQTVQGRLIFGRVDLAEEEKDAG